MVVLGIRQPDRPQGSQEQTRRNHRGDDAPTAGAQDALPLGHGPHVAGLPQAAGAPAHGHFH